MIQMYKICFIAAYIFELDFRTQLWTIQFKKHSSISLHFIYLFCQSLIYRIIFDLVLFKRALLNLNIYMTTTPEKKLSNSPPTLNSTVWNGVHNIAYRELRAKNIGVVSATWCVVLTGGNGVVERYKSSSKTKSGFSSNATR